MNPYTWNSIFLKRLTFFLFFFSSLYIGSAFTASHECVFFYDCIGVMNVFVRQHISNGIKWEKESNPDDSHLVASNCCGFCFRHQRIECVHVNVIVNNVNVYTFTTFIKNCSLSPAHSSIFYLPHRLPCNIWYQLCAMSIIIVIHSAEWLQCIHLIMLSTDNKLLIRVYVLLYTSTLSYTHSTVLLALPFDLLSEKQIVEVAGKCHFAPITNCNVFSVRQNR